MTFEEFKDEVFTKVKDARPDLTLELTEITRSAGEKYTGIAVRGRTLAPVVNLNAFYENYNNGSSVTTVVDEVCNIFEENATPEGLNFDPEETINYDKVNHFIFPRLVPKKDQYLALPHTEVADLLIVFGIRMFENDDGFGEGLVTQDLLESWDVSPEEVLGRSMINLSLETYEDLSMGPMTMISNRFKSKGAAMALHPEVMTKYSDCYILPSSIDDIIAIPKDAVDDVDMLKEMVKTVNDSKVSENMRLSYNVYEYRDGKLEVAV